MYVNTGRKGVGRDSMEHALDRRRSMSVEDATRLGPKCHHHTPLQGSDLVTVDTADETPAERVCRHGC
ncbi:hypothetical protein LX32DRAFT_646869 [Colletotrichum zoysiae]|uniref:Uncharacterized protein n=1 Tax=Colletotrichum zoysiae TaxID=1216348 RepID=A0AAD9H3S6_9PEZI|nr:hypothetical protein LX32DRAFT_646869 [Colletotrichum zoysiae]